MDCFKKGHHREISELGFSINHADLVSDRCWMSMPVFLGVRLIYLLITGTELRGWTLTKIFN